MELASKWDSLTALQQRYIATQAAGSRQQSRFIALMSDYARTQELVGKAYNANGASARQFEKTQDSLESKLSRLKNAWNEFLMGLTNNQMVKGFVGGLTNLLNFINKLTSGFNAITNSILKFGVALGGIFGARSLLSTGGLVDKGLMALLNGTIIDNALNKTGILTQADGATAGGAAARTPLIFGSGSLLSKAGKGLWNQAQILGLAVKGRKAGGLGAAKETFSFLGGNLGADATIAGLTGIGTALGAIAVAVGLVVAGYQAWLHLTPEGQLKQAEAIAEAMNTTAANAQKAAEEMRNASESYKEYNNAVKNARTIEDRNEAIQNRNEYIQSLLEQNETLAEYVTASQEDGQFILTINEEQLAAAVKNAPESAAKAAISANFANALQAGKRADVFEARLQRAKVDLENRTISRAVGRGNFIDQKLTNAEYAKYEQDAQAAAEQRSQQRSFATQAYLQDLVDTGLKDDVATMLAGALADTFDTDQYLKDINAQKEGWWIFGPTKQQLRDEYAALYKTEADTTMDKEQLRKAIAQYYVDGKRSEDTKKIADLIQGDQAESYKALLEAWTGTGKMAEIKLEGQSFEDILSQLGFDDLTQDQLTAFADALGITTDKLGEHIAAVVEDTKKIQAQARANVFETMMRAGMTISTEQQELINGMAPAQIEQINTIAGAAEGLLSPENYQQLISDLISGTIDESFATQLTELFSSINLDDPIGAFHELVDAKEEASRAGNNDLVAYIEKIQEVNESLFTASNLVQSFIVSADYEELTDQLGEFIEENGRISAKNIEELASSNSKLKQLLDSNTVSVKALANALTLIEQGKLGFENLTDVMLKALGVGESFEELIENVHSWIEDFDPGTDLGEGADHVISILEDFNEYVSNWEFGNQPVENIYDHLFGEGAYEAYLKANWGKKSYDQLEQELLGRAQTITKLFEDNGVNALEWLRDQVDWISGNGLDFNFDLSQFSSVQEVNDSVRNSLQELTGLQLDDNAIRALLEAWKTHMADLGWEMNELASREKIETYIENLGDAKIATEQDLIALGAAVDETGHVSAEKLQEIIDRINQARAQARKDPIEIPVIVNWQDDSGTALSGEDLLNQYKEQFGTGETIQLDVPYEVSFNGITYQRDRLYEDVDSAFADLQQYINAETNTIDIDGVLENLASKGLSDAQAAEVAQEFASELGGALLQRTIEVPVLNADGAVEMVEQTVTGADLSALEANINAKFESAKVQLIAQNLAGADYSGLSDSVGAAAETGIYEGAISGWNTFVNSLQPISVPVAFTGETASDATGGVVQSLANGSANIPLSPGFALTGEEGPEIIWNKNAGYAYVTGRNGPEFQNLQPGDRVFNAAETSRIFRNSSFARGGIFDSFSSGGWKPGGSGSSSGNTKKDSTWRNELDWLYDLMEDIAEYERQQTILQSKYDIALKDITTTGHDLFKLTQKELINLETQLDAQEAAQLKRLQQMNELQTQVKEAGYGKYIQYNQKDQTLEIDWDRIEAIQDKDTYDEITDWISRMENVQSQMDDAEKAIWDIRAQIQELQDRYLQSYLDFQQRVLDAVVKQYQDTIDNFSELNSTLNDTNSAILDSIQKEIDLERQIRDNTDTEKNIADMEARLAYLQRDTTGANDVEIRQLQQELTDAREDYSDTLVDQSIDRLNEANDAAAKQREKQIELMQAQLDYWQESGSLWGEVADLISAGFTQQGTIIKDSDLWEILKNADSWNSLSEAQKKNWANELILETNEVGAHLVQLSGSNDINFSMIRDSIANVGGLLTQDIRAVADEVRSLRTALTGKLGGTPEHSYTTEKVEGYASGGLNTKTGPTMLHGTPSEPEYVLNARQTDAFLRLADVLPGVFNTSSTITNTYGGNSTFNVEVNVESISNDYDVDNLVARIKEDLYNAASYRNGNPLGFLR